MRSLCNFGGNKRCCYQVSTSLKACMRTLSSSSHCQRLVVLGRCSGVLAFSRAVARWNLGFRVRRKTEKHTEQGHRGRFRHFPCHAMECSILLEHLLATAIFSPGSETYGVWALGSWIVWNAWEVQHSAFSCI